MPYHISCTALKFCSEDRIINVCIDSQAGFFFHCSDSVLCNTCKFIFLMPQEMENYVHLQLTGRQQRHIQNSPKSQCWILVHILRKGLHFQNTVYHMAQFCSKLKLLLVISHKQSDQQWQNLPVLPYGISPPNCSSKPHVYAGSRETLAGRCCSKPQTCMLISIFLLSKLNPTLTATEKKDS